MWEKGSKPQLRTEARLGEMMDGELLQRYPLVYLNLTDAP